jgi:glycosyltransferase involved in cell wall biosynthesis
MIFLGKEHPLFSSYVKNHIEKSYFLKDMNSHRGIYIPQTYLEDSQKYFIHPGLPMVDRNADIEYIFNFEDQTTLYRLIDNGFTYDVDFQNHLETDYIRYVLEDPRCKKIICHIEKMAKALPRLLGSNTIANKTVYEKVGIDLKVDNFIPKEKKDTINILFTNSYYDWDGSFYLRGGHILVNVFNLLCKKHKNIHLTIRSSIPKSYTNLINADPHHDPYNNPNIEIIEYLPESELDNLYKKSDIVVLPSARVHSHSICQAFSHGIPVISTDGWGIDEFIIHEETGLIMKGFNKISWNNEDIGCVENYNNVYKVSMQDYSYYIEQLYFYLNFLIENPEGLNTLKNNCLETCKNKYSLLNWKKWKI